MRCLACEHENRSGRRFCSACGVALPVGCPACGFENEPADRFCGGCGAALSPAAPAQALGPAPAPAPAPPPPPEAERRQVTVLFADLSGFTALSRTLDAEQLRAVLDRFFAVVDGLVIGYGGSIDKHIGDAVMGVFGAPVAHHDDPLRAVRAAIEIREAMPALSRELGHSLEIHVGLASGQVVAGGIGGEAYTVLGDSVNLAARLVDLAGPGEILIPAEVHALVAEQVEGTALGPRSVRGLDRRLDVWRVERVTAGDEFASRGALVGRDAELARFEEMLDACMAGGGGKAEVLRGEAGIGKTRLIQEVAAAARRRGFVSHRVQFVDFGASAGEDTPRGLVRALLQVDTEAGAEACAAAVDRAVALIGEEPVARACLLEMLRLPLPLPLRSTFDAMAAGMRQQAELSTALRLLEAEAARQPRVVAFEDLHWADAASLTQLAAVVAAIGRCAAILILTVRAEHDPLTSEWRARIGDVPLPTLDLGPLRPEDARRLADETAGVDATVLEACIARAEGHPLFLEQLLRNATEAAEQVPATIQSLVLARMDRLAPIERQAIQAASAAGLRVPQGLLSHLLEGRAFDADSLIAAHLLQRDGADFRFVHPLIRDAVHGALLTPQRQALHGAAAAWYAGSDPGLQAEHLELAGDTGAADAFLQAALAAAAGYRYQSALQLVERGLACAQDARQRCALILMRGELLRELGDPRASITVYREALAEASSDDERCRAWIGIAAGSRLQGQPEEGLSALAEAEPLADACGLVLEQAQVHYHRGNLEYALGHIDRCLRSHQAALDCAQAAGSHRWRALALGGLGDAHYAAGRMRQTLRYTGECVALCREHGFGGIEAANRLMLAQAWRYLNELPRAINEVEDAAAVAEQTGNRRAHAILLIVLGEFLMEGAAFDTAEAPLEQALAEVDSLANRRFRPYVLMHYGRCAWGRGRQDEAERLLAEALADSRATDPTFVGPRVCGTLALVASDPQSRSAALVEGERILTRPCLAHNLLWFHRDAIDACLAAGAWSAAERHAEALEGLTGDDPLPWPSFFAARGRLLAQLGRTGPNSDLAAQIESLCETARRGGLLASLPALEQARATAADRGT